jgi:hypothetical protein
MVKSEMSETGTGAGKFKPSSPTFRGLARCSFLGDL